MYAYIHTYSHVLPHFDMITKLFYLAANSDADDAVKARDGYDYDGYRLRVEFPRGGGPGSYRGNNRNDRSRDGGGRMGGRGPPAKRSQYRVMVTGLPGSGSWQDLKDHMREAGDVCFADTYKDGSGVVEFLRHEDMKYAIKKLDDSRFRSHEVRILFIMLTGLCLNHNFLLGRGCVHKGA